MPSRLTLKLAHGAPLSAADRKRLEALMGDATPVPAHEDLLVEGNVPRFVHVLLDGFAYRYKTLPDGSRQILAWLIPGDFCDLHVSVLGEMDHAIATASASRVGHLPRDGLEAITAGHPQLARAFLWATLVDAAILREWLANLGRRSGERRLAHLFCELLARAQAVGLAPDDVVEFPLTQVDLGDTAGLSAVHVNRVVQQLREAGLIAWRGGRLSILDRRGLEALAGFNPAYLHLNSASL